MILDMFALVLKLLEALIASLCTIDTVRSCDTSDISPMEFFPWYFF